MNDAVAAAVAEAVLRERTRLVAFVLGFSADIPQATLDRIVEGVERGEHLPPRGQSRAERR